MPSYEIGYESGIQKGKFEGMLDSAKLIVERFNLSIKSVSKELNILLDELKRYIKKDKNK